MTKKDYELIAKTIYLMKNELKTTEEKMAMLQLSGALSAKFQMFNYKFDVDKFLTMCRTGE